MNGTAFTEPAGTDFCSVRAGGEQSYEVTLFKIQILTMLYCSAYTVMTKHWEGNYIFWVEAELPVNFGYDSTQKRL